MLSPPQVERPQPFAIYAQRMPLGDRLLEWICAMAAFLMLCAPRGAFIYFAILLTGLLVNVLARPENVRDGLARFRQRLARTAASPASLATGAFLIYSALSALWSVLPAEAIAKAVQAAALLAGLLAALAAISLLPAFSRWLAARGVVHGAAAGLAYIAIEQATGGAVKAALVNTTGVLPTDVTFNIVQGGEVTSIDTTFLNRHTTALVLLAWPVVACLAYWCAGRVHVVRGLVGIWLTAVAAAAFVSESETAKLAVIAGLALYGLAQVSRRWAFRAAAVGWTALALGIAVWVLLVFPPGNSLQSRLPFSAEDRVIVWRYTIAEMANAPFFGVGANMTPILHEREKAADPAKSQAHVPRLGHHAHNVFLQTWFELGAVGAVLLWALGLACLQVARTMPPATTAFALALFASATAVASTGYGMWQLWLLASGFLAVALLRLPDDAHHAPHDSR